MTTPTQVVILAAGVSKRMAPFNQSANKPQMELMGKPVLSWTLEALKTAGLKHITIVVNPGMTFGEAYWQYWQGQFDQLDLAVQEVANGQAGGLVAALDKLDDNFYVVNATNCLADVLLPNLTALDSELALLSIQTDQGWLYGTVIFDPATGLVSEIKEKSPDLTQPAYRIVGGYRLSKAFVSELATKPLTDTALEELLAIWAKQARVKAAVITEVSPTIKYPWHLLDFKEYLWSKLSYEIDPTAIIAPTAVIKGQVFIGAGAIIGDFAIIEGPAYIGAKAVVGQFCIVRKGSILETGAQIQRYGDVANSILMAGAHVHSGFVGDSLIGQNSTIGAGFITANRRMDRGEISAFIAGKKVKTGRTSLGAMIGPDCKIGIQVGTMPNVIVMAGSVVNPGTIVKQNIS